MKRSWYSKHVNRTVLYQCVHKANGNTAAGVVSIRGKIDGRLKWVANSYRENEPQSAASRAWATGKLQFAPFVRHALWAAYQGRGHITALLHPDHRISIEASGSEAAWNTKVDAPYRAGSKHVLASHCVRYLILQTEVSPDKPVVVQSVEKLGIDTEFKQTANGVYPEKD